ncbi:hypothetical protein EUGRSUZ_B02859 [Eucalyptus grandis]|uniref:Uncharacterized protein n=2 Tax=Eucalyptus grandis TaxID=71139 RepID=A0ACC3LVM5_EUCGR|nr:hypothetical protein EUGRSUZ_B02859 [Eucalyptus grandis]
MSTIYRQTVSQCEGEAIEIPRSHLGAGQNAIPRNTISSPTEGTARPSRMLPTILDSNSSVTSKSSAAASRAYLPPLSALSRISFSDSLIS